MLIAFAVLASACTSGDGVEAGDPPETTTTTRRTVGDTVPPRSTTTIDDEEPSGTPDPEPPACTSPLVPAPAPGPALEIGELDGVDTAATAIALSEATFACATDVVVTSTTDLDGVAMAARLAVSLRGPLLFSTAGSETALAAEIARLGAHRVVLVGPDARASVPEYTQVERLGGTASALADRVNDFLGVYQELELPSTAGPSTVAVTIEAIDREAGLRPAPPPPPTTTTTTTLATTSSGASTTTTAPATTTTTVPEAPVGLPVYLPDEDRLPTAIEGSGSSGVAWLVDDDLPEVAIAAAVVAATSGGLMALVDGDDLRRNADVGVALQAASPLRSITLVGEMTENRDWQLQTLLTADELPGGGYLMFPGKRLVALYGNPLTVDLGVLGEQGPEEAVTLARQLAAPYDEEDIDVIPAFEIIVTVAAGDAGVDGNYSNEFGGDVIGPWIDIAREEGLYVILDLQPGRTDFLTQAKLYEEFLLEPHVGLALDPEWRLKPDQFHLRQIGTVTAAEVNSVVDWLAELTRDNGLPQKVLLLHQFRVSMLQDRATIRTPEELAVLIQMDGQGAINTKYNTWAVLTEGWPDHRWRWGWKNFFDEDIPTPTPEEVLALTPYVVYVSYQ